MRRLSHFLRYLQIIVYILGLFSLGFEGGALLRLHALSGRGVEDNLSESDALRGDLDELLVGDKLDSLFKRKLYGGYQSELFISARGTDSGKVLLLAYVDLDIIGLGILANYHTLVYRGCGADEQRTSVLRLIKTVGGGNTLLGCNER